MYLHIGGDVIVYVPEIVAILNLSTTDGQINTQNKSVVYVTQMPPKSLIIQKTTQQETLYYSPISTTTLNKRLKYPYLYP